MLSKPYQYQSLYDFGNRIEIRYWAVVGRRILVESFELEERRDLRLLELLRKAALNERQVR